MELASHLGITLQEVQAKTSSTELPLWCAYLRMKKEEEFESHSKTEYYYACILAEIRRTFVKNPQKIKWKDFLLKFDLKNPKKAPKVDPEARMEKSKASWKAILGGFSKKKDKNGN